MPSGIYKSNRKDRIGIRYGHLIVIKFTGTKWDGSNWFTIWECLCNCGNKIIVKGNSLQSGNTKSCGCLYKKRKGKVASHYINGKFCEKYTKETLELKEEIRKRDNYICQNCGMIQEKCLTKYGRKLDAHHIDGDDTNNIKENMITLCKGCHSKITKTSIKNLEKAGD